MMDLLPASAAPVAESFLGSTFDVDRPWDEAIAGLLDELLAVQEELFALLAEKQRILATRELTGLDDVHARETVVVQRLQACYERRGAMLAEARRQGLPGGTVRQLAGAIDTGEALSPRIETASRQMRLLQHHGLANWVVVQRSLLHLGQMLEIIATGGRPRPTYSSAARPGEDSARGDGGTLMDEAA